jgi:choline dehydrogenase
MNPDPFSGFLTGAQPTRPTSRGFIEIKSANPLVSPLIQPNYLSTEIDVQEILEGTRLLRKLAKSPPLAKIIESEIHPGQNVQTDDELMAYIRETAGTVYHPVSTCKMGPNASSDVVDNQLRVHGLYGLRVVDASIFPTVTSGNTNAPTIMVGEKAADIILSAHGEKNI